MIGLGPGISATAIERGLQLIRWATFDRMLIAQATLEDLHLVSIERAFDAYGVLRLW